MKQFYNVFSDEKVSPIATQLSWSHYTELLPIKDENKMLYYLNITINLNLSRNDLRNRIKNKEYERLPEETKNKLITKEETKVKDLVKNPIIIKNSSNYEIISEKILQRLILEDIPSFLKELGNGFTFIENEYKIKLGDKYNYIDLLLYNIKFRCYVIIELKVTELRKEHIKFPFEARVIFNGNIQGYIEVVSDKISIVKKGSIIRRYRDGSVSKRLIDKFDTCIEYELIEKVPEVKYAAYDVLDDIQFTSLLDAIMFITGGNYGLDNGITVERYYKNQGEDTNE